MDKNYTTQVLGSNSEAESLEAFFPQLEYLSEEIRKARKKKHKGKKSKHAKEIKKQLKSIEEQQQLTQQLLALAIWQCQAQSSVFATESPKKKKKQKSKSNKKPTWFEEVLVQSLPTLITNGFDRMLPPPQSQSMLALPDGHNHKQ